MKKWLDDNDILIYSAYNKGKSVVAGRFRRRLKGKIYKKTLRRLMVALILIIKKC